MLQRYTFYYIKVLLYKNIFIGLIYCILNGYGLQTAKVRRANKIFHTKFRAFSAKSAKKQKTATLENMAVKQKQQKINKLQIISLVTYWNNNNYKSCRVQPEGTPPSVLVNTSDCGQ